MEIFVLVEGQTEYRFVDAILKPDYSAIGIFLTPVIIKSRINPSGPDCRGGISTYKAVQGQLRSLMRASHAVITTLMDFYGLPADFPGMRDVCQTPRLKVQHIQNAVLDDLGRPPNFLPFFMLHEFEAILFSSSETLPYLMQATPQQKGQFSAICRNYGSPEDIDNSPQSSPSHRILAIFPEYVKPVHGIQAIQSIGLDAIKKKCPHLKSWLDTLAQLSLA